VPATTDRGADCRLQSVTRTLLWQRIDTVGVEYAELEWEPLRLRGEVALVEEGAPFAVSYRVECDTAGLTARAHVQVKRSGAQHELTLTRSPAGEWTANGRSRPELQGIADVDLSVTPSTNTPPIRRLRLDVGQAAEVTAAWVRLPSLDVVPLRQIYRRSEANMYEYEAPDLPFRAQLEVDGDGVVRKYGGLWRLVSQQPTT
jgi:uncharacterized protein